MRVPRRLRYGEEATLVEHLDELRNRLIVSLLALTATTAVAFVFHHRIVHWLEGPLPEDRRQLITFGVAEPFLTSFKISLIVGLGAALPVLLWQLWSFLAPAFEESSQRVVALFVGFASVLLACGVAFGYWLVLPQALHFLTHYDDQFYNINIRARDYFSFATAVLLGVGIVFELPIFVLGLVRLGILTTYTLRHNRRLGYFVVAVIAVLLPGIDPITTTFEGVPLVVLYEGSIWLAVLMERRWGVRETEAAAAEPL
jgi:sec-independent protein translocase protein TatC